MDVDRLLAFFSLSPLARILRADRAPYLLAFLHRVFKESERVEVGEEDFLVSLSDFQEELAESGEEVFQGDAKAYLAEWVGEGARFLRRFLTDGKEWKIELQPETEEALHFVERVLERQDRSLGTESRMQMIVEAIRELVLYASGDREAQLRRLEQERERIEEKISALSARDEGEALSGRQVGERFYLVLGMLRELTRDFRSVEEKFREMVREMRERERAEGGRAGDVLEYVLDAEDELREHPHGASFHAFVAFVLSGERRDDFDKMVDELTALPDLEGEGEGVRRLRGMMPLLTGEATKVLETTQRLSAALRRLLDPRATEENRQLRNELQEIMRCVGREREKELRSEVEVGVKLDSAMARDFWSPSQRFGEVEVMEGEVVGVEEMKRKAHGEYAALRLLDWRRMEERVAKALRRSAEVPLEHLIGDEELEAGLVELLGYLQLAHDDGHVVDESREVVLRVRLESGVRRVNLPRVVFVRREGLSL